MHSLKNSALTQEQVACELEQSKLCTKVEETCRKTGISIVTFTRCGRSMAARDRASCARRSNFKKKLGRSAAEFNLDNVMLLCAPPLTKPKLLTRLLRESEKREPCDSGGMYRRRMDLQDGF
jgi:hypothetical protein